MKTLIATILLTVSSMSYAGDYLLVTKGESESIFFKKQTFLVAKNDGGHVINMVQARGIRKSNPNEPIDFVAYVKQSECDKGNGSLFFVDEDGDVVAKAPFNFDGASTGNMTIIASRICQLAAINSRLPTM